MQNQNLEFQFFAFVFGGQCGIINQINSLKNAARVNALPISFNVCVVQSKLDILSLLFKLFAYHVRIIALSFFRTTHLLVRYNPRDPFLIFTCALLRRRVHLVFHTYAEKEVGSLWVISFFVKTYLNLALRMSGRIVAVTSEIGSFYKLRNADFVLMPNSIDYTSNDPQSTVNVEVAFASPANLSSNIHLLFVASRFAAWQGLDLILQSISSSSVDFTLSVVGNPLGEIIDDSRVIYHGDLDHSVLNSLYARSTLGLSCFALYRKGMKEACPLKVREYLANGLPVYGSHFDVFPSSFPFFFIGPPSIYSIIEYNNRIKNYTKDEIRNASREFIDTSSILEKTLNSFY